MLRFGHFFGSRPETFYAPSGIGDLILTTTEELSRNKSFGVEIAKGRSLPGRTQAHSGPNFHRLYQVLYENHDPKEVIGALMMLPQKFEEDA